MQDSLDKKHQISDLIRGGKTFKEIEELVNVKFVDPFQTISLTDFIKQDEKKKKIIKVVKHLRDVCSKPKSTK